VSSHRSSTRGIRSRMCTLASSSSNLPRRGEPFCLIVACRAGPLEQGEQTLQPIRAAGTLAAEMMTPKVPVVNSTVHIHPINGYSTRVPADATAFACRDAHSATVIAGMWPSPADNAKNVRWARNCCNAIAPHSAPAGYVNFMAEDDADGARANCKGNWNRLVSARKKHDPGKLFHIEQNINPSWRRGRAAFSRQDAQRRAGRRWSRNRPPGGISGRGPDRRFPGTRAGRSAGSDSQQSAANSSCARGGTGVPAVPYVGH
jgi:hypothetical protein